MDTTPARELGHIAGRFLNSMLQTPEKGSNVRPMNKTRRPNVPDQYKTDGMAAAVARLAGYAHTTWAYYDTRSHRYYNGSDYVAILTRSDKVGWIVRVAARDGHASADYAADEVYAGGPDRVAPL